MTTVLNGLLGGALAGVLASVIARAVLSNRSAAIAVVDALFGTTLADSSLTATLVDLLYGALAGGVLLALELYVLGLLGVPPSIGEAFGVGIGWGVVLLALATLVANAVGGRIDRATASHLVAYHLAFGLALGLWIRISWIT